MKKLFSVGLGLLLVVAFQNCGKPSFSSEGGSIRIMPFECPDYASCAPAAVLGRYEPTAVNELRYTRSGGFAPVGQRYSGDVSMSTTPAMIRPEEVRVTINHVTRKLVITHGLASTATIQPCQIELGAEEYEKLMLRLEEPYLAPATRSYIVDAGVGQLDLNVDGKWLSHIFESSDLAGAKEVIFNGGELEAQLRQYRDYACLSSTKTTCQNRKAREIL